MEVDLYFAYIFRFPACPDRLLLFPLPLSGPFLLQAIHHLQSLNFRQGVTAIDDVLRVRLFSSCVTIRERRLSQSVQSFTRATHMCCLAHAPCFLGAGIKRAQYSLSIQNIFQQTKQNPHFVYEASPTPDWWGPNDIQAHISPTKSAGMLISCPPNRRCDSQSCLSQAILTAILMTRTL